jgi:hypothetical protein
MRSLLFGALALLMPYSTSACHALFRTGWMESRTEPSQGELGTGAPTLAREPERPQGDGRAPAGRTGSLQVSASSASAVRVDPWPRAEEFMEDYKKARARAMLRELERERCAEVVSWQRAQPREEQRNDYPRSVPLARIGSFEVQVGYGPSTARSPWRPAHSLTEEQLLLKPYPEPLESR